MGRTFIELAFPIESLTLKGSHIYNTKDRKEHPPTQNGSNIYRTII